MVLSAGGRAVDAGEREAHSCSIPFDMVLFPDGLPGGLCAPPTPPLTTTAEASAAPPRILIKYTCVVSRDQVATGGRASGDAFRVRGLVHLRVQCAERASQREFRRWGAAWFCLTMSRLRRTSAGWR